MSKKKKLLTIGEQLRKLREAKEISLTVAAASVGVDIAILSKIERGERKLNRELLTKLVKLYHEDERQWLIHFLSEKLLQYVRGEKYGLEALKNAEKRFMSSVRKKSA